MANENQFVVTVADIILIDDELDAVVLKGKTLLSSALTQSVQNLEIKGGKGNQLLYDYSNEKKIEVKIEDAVWRESYIALNNGVSVQSGVKDFFIIDEAVTLTAGVGDVAQTPVGNVYVEKSDGTYITVTPATKTIDVNDATATSCKATYRYSTTVDSITITGEDFPKAYRLIMSTDLVRGKGKVADVEIIIPQYKISGNFEITFGANTAATSRIDGKALADEDGVYAEVYVKAVSGASTSYAMIAAYPGSVSIAEGATQQLTIYGIRGGIYANTTLDATDCTFASDNEAVATVSTAGLITGIGAGDTFITVEYGDLTDVVTVEVTGA
jgi:hypothetical protein